MKRYIVCFASLLVIVAFIKYGSIYTARERGYSEIRTDYLNQPNIDERFGFITGLNKVDFMTFFTNSSFVTDVLGPIGNCASSEKADANRCQALLVAIIRKCGEQALSYYGQYAQLMELIDRPFQIIRVLRDMYSDDPKRIAKALDQLILANPALARIGFRGDAADFGMMQYVLLKYATATLKNPADQTWVPLLMATIAYWQKNADNIMRSKIIDFSAPDIIALAQFDDFDMARQKAIDPSPLLTTQALAAVFGINL